MNYVLITPARNEAAFIEGTIRSVVAQTVRPARWIIVSDGSTDGTDDIVKHYAAEHPWIELLRMPERRDRQFAAKAHAFNAGYARLSTLNSQPSTINSPLRLDRGESDATLAHPMGEGRGVRDFGEVSPSSPDPNSQPSTSWDIIGNLDADITFESDYFSFLLSKFQLFPKLGVAGTPFVENAAKMNAHTYAHRFAQLEHVSGACQMFRRECFEQVGGYIPIKGGAIDWIAVTTARMKGWETRTFPEKVCLHHRKLGTGTHGLLGTRFHYGRKAYYVGGHPVWELLRGVFQMRERPWLLGGLWFQFGFLWAVLTRTPRPVSADLVAFHRKEQMQRLKRTLAPSSVNRRVRKSLSSS